MIETQNIQELPLWKKTEQDRIPFTFDLEVTGRCNNNCRHCYINLPVDDEYAKSKELTLAEIDDLTSEVLQSGGLWCNLTGGEPLLRPDFEEIYLLLKQKAFLTSVLTNATLISRKHIDLFKKYPPRDIEVTVYGVTQETYEKVTRVPGSFNRFMRGLHLFEEAGISVRLKAMIIKSNYDEHEDIIQFSKVHTKDYSRYDSQLVLRYDRDPDRNREILAERLTPDQIAYLDFCDQKRLDSLLTQLDYEMHKVKLVDDDKQDLLFRCGAGDKGFVVSHDGYLKLCSSLVAPGTIYDWRSGSFEDFWHRFIPEIKALHLDDGWLAENCKKCSLINSCIGCPAHIYLETGSLNGSASYFCEVAHRRYEMLSIREKPI